MSCWAAPINLCSADSDIWTSFFSQTVFHDIGSWVYKMTLVFPDFCTLLRNKSKCLVALRNFAGDVGAAAGEQMLQGTLAAAFVAKTVWALPAGLVPFCRRLTLLNLHHMLLWLWNYMFSGLVSTMLVLYCLLEKQRRLSVPGGPSAICRIPDFSGALLNYVWDKLTVIRKL